MTPDILDGALRDKAAHLGRTTQFSGREWLEAFTEIRSFRPRLGGAPMLTEAESEAVDRAVIDAALFIGGRPSYMADSLLSVMAACRRQRDERRSGGGPLAVDGHAYQRRLRNRRKRRRR